MFIFMHFSIFLPYKVQITINTNDNLKNLSSAFTYITSFDANKGLNTQVAKEEPEFKCLGPPFVPNTFWHGACHSLLYFKNQNKKSLFIWNGERNGQLHPLMYFTNAQSKGNVRS